MSKTNALLRRAAKLAKSRGLDLKFSMRDLGDLYHVYGVSASAPKLVAMLQTRAKGGAS